MDSALLHELIVELERPTGERLRRATQRMAFLEQRAPRRQTLRARLARTLVTLGLRLDADAGARFALAGR